MPARKFAVVRAAVAVRRRAGVPDRDLVDLDGLDGLDLHGDDLLELLDQQQRRRRARIVAGALHQRLVALRLALEHLADALRLGFVAAAGWRRPRPALRAGCVSASASAAIVDLLASRSPGARPRSAVRRCSSALRLRFLDLGLRVELRDLAALLRPAPPARIELGVRLRDVSALARVLAGDRLGLLRLHEDALVGLGRLLALLRPAPRSRATLICGRDCASASPIVGQRFLLLHVDALVGLGLLLALLGLGDVLRHLDGASRAPASASPTEPLRSCSATSTLRLVDGLGRRLLADALDVVRLVRDVGDVHVDQVQADLVQLRLDVAADRSPGISRGPG